MQYEITDRTVISATCADFGEFVEIQILTTDSEGTIVKRSPIAKLEPKALIALGLALSVYAAACTSTKAFHDEHDAFVDIEEDEDA